MKLKKILFGIGLLLGATAGAAVTLPYSFSPSTPIESSKVNANFNALRDGINNHMADPIAHNTRLSDVMGVSNSVGSYNLNFNLKQGLSMRVENLSSDPTCNSGSLGRLIWNTNDSLFKVCDGSSFVSIAGSGVNTLASVLSAGNTASDDIDLNGHELLSAKIENLSVDPSPGSAGRLFFNTSSSTLKLDTGAAITAIGGAQSLSSVLSVGNSAGSTNIDFNGNQAVNARLENLSSNPATTTGGRIYYNTSSHKPFFYNGSSWLEVGNTNTLAQVLTLGNSAGSTDLNMNGRQIKSMRLDNIVSPPGTGTAGLIWYDTGSDQIQYETSGPSNRTVCTLDGSQTLENKSISGSSNTLTNIPDSALSANAALLDANQTVSGTKTFSAAPVMNRIKTASGTTLGHQITDGLADDTFVLLNAAQTLSGKSLNATAMLGNLDFNNYQAIEMRAENLSSTPAAGNAGRIFYKTSTGELLYDTGSSWRVLSASGVTPNMSLSGYLATERRDESSAATINSLDSSKSYVKLTSIVSTINGIAAGVDGQVIVIYNNTGGNVTINNASGSASAVDRIITSNGSAITLADKSPQAFIYDSGQSRWVVWGGGGGGAGTVTDLSVVSANGFAGSVATSTTTPAITLSTTITGLLKGNGTAISAQATGDLTDAGTDGIVVTGGTGAVIGSGTSLAQHVADSTHNGYLSSTDWSTFNGKQAAGNYITALTGDVTASGPGSVAATIGANKVVDSMIRQSSGLSLVGRSANSTGNVADITAASDNQVFRRSGTSIGFGSLDLSQSNTVGSSILALANGGTGASTKAAAFDALSPMTTSGDIIYGGASGTGTRLAKGSDGQVLKLASGLPSWGSVPAGSIGVSAIKTTTYSISSSDDLVLVDSSGGAFTATLPTAAGITGKIIYVKKTDSSFNQVTIATTSSQTIDGSSTTKVSTQNEIVAVASDGSNWYIVHRRIPSNWFTISVTASAGFGTPTNSLYKARRVGDSLEYAFDLTLGTTAASALTFTLPSGIVIDSAKLSSALPTILGHGSLLNGVHSVFEDAVGIVSFYDGSSTTVIKLGYRAASSTTIENVNGSSIGSSGQSIIVRGMVPISGWDN